MRWNWPKYFKRASKKKNKYKHRKIKKPSTEESLIGFVLRRLNKRLRQIIERIQGRLWNEIIIKIRNSRPQSWPADEDNLQHWAIFFSSQSSNPWGFLRWYRPRKYVLKSALQRVKFVDSLLLQPTSTFPRPILPAKISQKSPSEPGCKLLHLYRPNSICTVKTRHTV